MCTASGRKAAQQAGTVERRAPGRMVNKSKFVGGQAALYKTVNIGSAAKKANYDKAVSDHDRLGEEAGGGYVDPRRYGGSTRDVGGEGGTEAYFGNSKPSSGVSGNTWTGASGRKYAIKTTTTEEDMGGDSGTSTFTTTSSVGKRYRGGYGIKDKWNVGSVKGGIDIGKTEDEARATYKDFGMDFDKDKYRGDFYKTTKGLANQQRQNTQGKESSLRKIHRIRNNGGPNTAAGNARRKAKKQGNLRINSSGVQGGSRGGGTTLS